MSPPREGVPIPTQATYALATGQGRSLTSRPHPLLNRAQSRPRSFVAAVAAVAEVSQSRQIQRKPKRRDAMRCSFHTREAERRADSAIEHPNFKLATNVSRVAAVHLLVVVGVTPCERCDGVVRELRMQRPECFGCFSSHRSKVRGREICVRAIEVVFKTSDKWD